MALLLLLASSLPLLLALRARRHARRAPTKPPRAPLAAHPAPPPAAAAAAARQRLCDASLAALLALPAAAPPLAAPALIESAEALAQALAAHLPRAAVLGLDVEWSPRSFRGHTCLLQLALQPSGCTLVVDALVPEVRRALGAPGGPLARALADPLLLKVLHAGHNDARWLLQDLGLRLCGVLDTALLAQELQDSARDSPSLAALLVECGVGGAGGGGGSGGGGSGGASAVAAAVASKKAYQTSDWRRRPLPPDHLLYAAKDAHYLPFLARALLARLLARGGALPQPLPCSPARAYFASLLPQRLLRQCAALESPTGHLEALAAREVFAPAEALAAALRQLVAWRREEHCSGPLGLAADRPASTATATAYILGAVPLSRAEALFAHTFLAASRARHALALAADVNMLLEVATNAALASACRAAVVAAVGCKAECSGGASAPYQAALDSLPHSPFCESLASALCSACTEAAGREGAYLCASLEEGTHSGGGGEALREVVEGEGGSSGAPEPLPLQTDAPPHSQQPHPLSAAAHRDRIKQQRASRIFMPRATPLYSNCELLTPDGVVLARVDKAKCLWYLEKGVGEVVGEDGAPAPQALLSTLRASSTGQTGGPVLRVRMFNAPKGLGHAGDAFHLQPRANVCVVCGLEWKVSSSGGGSSWGGGGSAGGGCCRAGRGGRGGACSRGRQPGALLRGASGPALPHAPGWQVLLQSRRAAVLHVLPQARRRGCRGPAEAHCCRVGGEPERSQRRGRRGGWRRWQRGPPHPGSAAALSQVRRGTGAAAVGGQDGAHSRPAGGAAAGRTGHPAGSGLRGVASGGAWGRGGGRARGGSAPPPRTAAVQPRALAAQAYGGARARAAGAGAGRARGRSSSKSSSCSCWQGRPGSCCRGGGVAGAAGVPARGAAQRPGAVRPCAAPRAHSGQDARAGA